MKTHRLFLIIFLFLPHLFMYSQKPSVQTLKPVSGRPSSISRGVASTSGTVYIDLNKAILSTNYLDIPVSFTSTDSIVALDLALKFNDSVLSYLSVLSYASYLTDALAHYSPDDKTLRFTSNSFHTYIADQTIATLRFNRSGPLKDADLFGFVGFLNGDKVHAEIRGHLPFRTCSLKFWLDNSPIKYDVNAPDNYLITNIYGVDSNCSGRSVPVQPDLNGQFSYPSVNGPAVQIERDILSSTVVQPVINDFDINLGNKILVNDLSFIPNIYQVIALDVNADGVISAGDISQINQRSVKTIPEFKQKWNYNNNGTSNGQPSKDWLFIDSPSLSGNAYHVSTTYPFNDGIGYSKSKVPTVQFCLPAPAINTIQTSYTGILLGDANGNYAALTNDGKIKRPAIVKK